PTPLVTLDELWQRAAIGPIPGGLVIAAGILFHGGWVGVVLITLRIGIASRRERGSLISMGEGAPVRHWHKTDMPTRAPPLRGKADITMDAYVAHCERRGRLAFRS